MSILNRPAAPVTATQATAGAPARQPRRWRAGRVAGYCFLVVLALVFIGPLVWMILTSLKPQSDVFAGPLIPRHLPFGAYSYVWKTLGIGTNFLNSVYVTALTVAGVVVVSSLAGYAFTFLPIPAKNLVFGLLMCALLLPSALFLIPAFIELRNLGMLNTRTGLALVHTGAGVPLAIYLMRNFFGRSVPGELRDAARIDGANEVTNWPALCAALTIAAVPVVAFFILAQRLFVSGLLVGSVKG